MGWFSKGDRREPDSAAAPAADGAADGMPDDDALPGRPRWRALSEEQRAALDTDLAALRAADVDVTDLPALGSALDAAMAAWYAVKERDREDYAAVTHRWGVALGAFLESATDLRWGMVTDVYGTDLGLMGSEDDMVIVPQNLVSARWLNHQTGWVPGVLGHIVRLRTR